MDKHQAGVLEGCVHTLSTLANTCIRVLVLYHQPEKMAKSKEDLAERQENLEKLKRQHGIE